MAGSVNGPTMSSLLFRSIDRCIASLYFHPNQSKWYNIQVNLSARKLGVFLRGMLDSLTTRRWIR